MTSEAQKRATANYRKRVMKVISFRLHKEHETELIEVFEKIPNKAEWFRQKLREEAEK